MAEENTTKRSYKLKVTGHICAYDLALSILHLSYKVYNDVIQINDGTRSYAAMCTQINKILKKYSNGYISAKTKSSKLKLMQVQKKYELVLIHCHTIVTTGSYILLDGVQTQHYNLYCHVIQIKLSRAICAYERKVKTYS
jgi:hypothetical protein